MTTDLEKARRAYVEATIVDMLVKNWFRITRYPDSEMARPAFENIAREIRERIEKAPVPHG